MQELSDKLDARIALFRRALARAGVPETADDFYGNDVCFYANGVFNDAVYLTETEDGVFLEGWVYGERRPPGRGWTLRQRAYGAILTVVARDPEVVEEIVRLEGEGIEITDELVEEVLTAPEDEYIPTWLRQWMMLRLGS